MSKDIKRIVKQNEKKNLDRPKRFPQKTNLFE